MSEDCPNNNNCEVGRRIYGWPMNSWCVGNVTDMSWLFYDMSTFNDDISTYPHQNTKHVWSQFILWMVIYEIYVLYGATSFNGDVSAWDIDIPGQLPCMLCFGCYFIQPRDLCAWGINYTGGIFTTVVFLKIQDAPMKMIPCLVSSGSGSSSCCSKGGR